MKAGILIALVALGVAGCGVGTRMAEPARFDLGVAAAPSATGLPLAGVEVTAASWLAGSAMHYRLGYAEAQRRHVFTESRWSAPPAELLETWLRRQLGNEAAGCRLNLVLDDFEQSFESPQSSQLVIEARASLLAARGGDMLARRSFRIQQPALTPDARGGAAAAREAAKALGDGIAAWTAELGRSKPALTERCRT